MLHWCSLKFFVYGRHINNVVIIRRLLVGIYVVNILATKCFDHICVLVPYEEFEEVEHAFHIYHTPNYMMVNIVNMDWLEDALTVFRDMCWDSFSPTEASGESIALLEIYNSYDHEIEESQLLANYHDAILKLLIAVSDTHKPFVDFLRSSWSLKCCLQELVEINEMNGSVDSSNEFKILLHQSQVLAHELHLVHTWICLSDCIYVLENIHRYFYDIAMGRRLDFISPIGGNAIALLCLYIMQSNLGHPKLILELLTEAVCVEQQQQWFVPLNGPLWRGIVVGFPSFQKCLDITRENDFYVPEFQLFTHVIFGSNIWIGSTIFLLSCGFQSRNINIVSTVSKYIDLIVHASIVRAQELMRINDGKKKEAPDVYVPIRDSYQSCVVCTTSYLHVSKYCTSLVDASFHSEHGADRVCQNFYVAAILHRKMINWGNVRDAKILIKWKALPLKHGTCD